MLRLCHCTNYEHIEKFTRLFILFSILNSQYSQSAFAQSVGNTIIETMRIKDQQWQRIRKSTNEIERRICHFFPFFRRRLCSKAKKYQETFLDKVDDLVEIFKFPEDTCPLSLGSSA